MHLSRKAFHATGIVIVLIYRGADLSRTLTATVLWVLVALLAIVDMLRWRYPAIQERFLRSFAAILDKKDHKGWNGSTLYFCGCALAVTLFPKDPACAGMLALALGDPAAAIVGSSIKSPKLLSNVSVAGSIACLFAASAACLLFYSWPLALLGGAVATIAEAVSGAKLDNLTIPVGVGTVLHFL